jgi:glycosyltransferase involved in cell wall biosynthesis
MQNGKFIVAKLWPKFEGDIPSRAPVILGINPEKYEIITIYLTKNSSNPNIFEQKGKKVFYLTQKPSLGLLEFFAIFKLASLLKKQHVDIFDCHHHKSIVLGTIAAKLTSVPIILANIHGMGRTRNMKRKLLNFFLLPHIDKIFAVGQAVKEDILKTNPSVKPENVINLGNSIDYDYYSSYSCSRKTVRDKLSIPQNAYVFATAGRLAPTKGQQYLIKAFSQVKKQIPAAELFFAGTGELKNQLEKQASDLNCKTSVHFLDHVDNMPEFYSAVDTLVLPSVAEGLPRTLLEAMASGVFCIAANAGGIPEILDNGACGLLVPAKDSNALADAMLKAANMPQIQKSVVISAAKKHIKENYAHDVMIKRVEKIYDALVAEKIKSL